MLFRKKETVPVVFAVLLIMFCGGSFSQAAVDLYVDVSKGAGRKVAIGVPAFEGDPVLGAKAAEIMSHDLEFSGYFKTVSPGAVSGDAAAGAFGDWLGAGAELLVLGEVEKGSEIKVQCRLYDIKLREQILGKALSGSSGLFRKMVHRFSDEIVERVTGKQGIAQTRLAFVSNITGHKEIYVVDYDGYNPRRVTRAHSLATAPTWLPGNRQIAYTSYRDNNPDLCVKDVLGGSPQRICSFQGLNYGISFAPGGKEYAITLSKDGNSEIYAFSIDGKTSRRLTENPRVDCSPSWSPDGRYIAFTSGRRGGPHLYIMDTSGNMVRRLTASGYNDTPDWSPTGDLIAFSSLRGNTFDIWVISPDGTGARRLTGGEGDDENPSFSPDGRHIAFSSTRDGNKNIYLMDIDGSNQTRLTFMKGNAEYPAWSGQ